MGRLGVVALGWLAGAGLLMACGGPSPAEEQARLAKLNQDGQALEQALDTVEVRLIRGQSSVALWSELARRHQQVSALACTNLGKHYQGMVRYLAYQERKARRLRRHSLSEDEPVLSLRDTAGHGPTQVAQATKLQRSR